MSFADQFAQEMAEESNKGPCIIPEGTFQMSFQSVEEYPEKYYSHLFFVMQNNPNILMTDDETPIDGQRVSMTIFWPKPGDESARTSNGRMTKRQSKLRRAGTNLAYLGVTLEPPIDYTLAYGTTVLGTIKHREFNNELQEELVQIRPIA